MSHAGPEAHRAASLVLFERLADDSGRPAAYEALRRLLDRPTPQRAGAQDRSLTLKYDFYVGKRQGSAWGVAMNDALEGAEHPREVLRFARSLGQGYRLAAVQELARRMQRVDASLTFAVGFDAAGSTPRLKFYFQERSWNAGVLRGAGLRGVLETLVPGAELPSFVAPSRAVGVVAVDLTAGGGVAVKAYLGHHDLEELCADAPAEAKALASELKRVSPLPGQYHYLTVRARAGQPPRYSVNKIYDVTALVENGRDEDAWADAAGLFELTGDQKTFERLRALTAGLVALPTATALEDGGQAADLYVAAVRPQ
jgi:hypothetical protein